ncbi:hypothetical protein Tco_0455231 [Tanacetum coccineum]
MCAKKKHPHYRHEWASSYGLSPSITTSYESQVVLRKLLERIVYTLDLKNIIPFGGEAQVWQDELEMMVTQELVANALNDESRQAFEEEKRRIASQKKAAKATSTNILSTDRPFLSTNRPFVSTDRPFVSTDKPFVSIISTPTKTNMPDLEDASKTLPNEGIFNGAYDDNDDVGAVADFHNMDNTIDVSPIPTIRIHKDHPKGQILGDPSSVVQTREHHMYCQESSISLKNQAH